MTKNPNIFLKNMTLVNKFLKCLHLIYENNFTAYKIFNSSRVD